MVTSVNDAFRPGVTLVHTTISFTGPAMDSAVLGNLNARISMDDTKTWWARGFLLPTSLVESAVYLVLEVHSHGPEYDETHWELDFVTAPGGDPPETIRHAQLTGAYPEGIAGLATLLTDTDIDAWLRLRYLAETEQLKMPLTGVGLFEKIVNGDSSLIPQRIDWAVKGRPFLTQLSLEDPDEESVWIIATGERRLRIKPSLLEEVDDLIWKEVAACLTMIG